MKFSIRQRSSMGDTKIKLSSSFELQIRYLFLKYILTFQLHDKVTHMAKKYYKIKVSSTLKNAVFWDVAPYRSCGCSHLLNLVPR
jgi:hypothetical protein